MAGTPAIEPLSGTLRGSKPRELHAILNGTSNYILGELEAGAEFIIAPYLRFAGEPGEQWTMFFLDPSGNALEFKAFADPAQLFATS